MSVYRFRVGAPNERSGVAASALIADDFCHRQYHDAHGRTEGQRLDEEPGQCPRRQHDLLRLLPTFFGSSAGAGTMIALFSQFIHPEISHMCR
jgi:hypothetical protein